MKKINNKVKLFILQSNSQEGTLSLKDESTLTKGEWYEKGSRNKKQVFTTS